MVRERCLEVAALRLPMRRQDCIGNAVVVLGFELHQI